MHNQVIVEHPFRGLAPTHFNQAAIPHLTSPTHRHPAHYYRQRNALQESFQSLPAAAAKINVSGHEEDAEKSACRRGAETRRRRSVAGGRSLKCYGEYNNNK